MSATSTESDPIYRDRLAVWADKYLFFVLFVAGTATIWIMKAVHVRQLTVTAAPLTTMICYAVYILKTPRYRIRSDRAGDSLYYLGFLYTMVSLAYSLYEFGKSESNTADVVTNFGIALSTTILGLALRVVYHQMREDPFDIEQEARVELADAAQSLHGVLLNAESDFERLRLTVSQVVTEATNDTKARLKAIAEEVESNTKIQTEFLTQFSAGAANELREHHAEMLTASRAMTTAVKRIAERIEKVEVPSDTIKNRLEVVAIPVDIIKNRLESIDIPSDVIKRRLEGIDIPKDLIKDRLQKIDVPANVLRERLEAIEIPSDIFTRRFDELIGQLQGILNIFVQGTTDNIAVMERLEALVKSAAEAADNLRSAIHDAQTDDEHRRQEINSSLEIFTGVVKSLGATSKSLADLSAANVAENKKLLEQLATSVASTLKTVGDHRGQLEKDLQSSREAVQQVHGSLVSLTRTVVEKLNGRA